jgi:2-amino-4-hydroxy-6-hydroxymethyldihydropteridine diphosphokinase
MTTAYIGVGSNIDREKHVQAAYAELASVATTLRSSRVYECAPVGFDSHPFYNLVFEVETELSLTEFSHFLRITEIKWGRDENAQKFQDRTLDLDIVLFGEVVSEASPQLPRSDIFKYPFVIQPLYELCPERVVPGDGRTVKQIWQQMDGYDTLSPVNIFLTTDKF